MKSKYSLWLWVALWLGIASLSACKTDKSAEPATQDTEPENKVTLTDSQASNASVQLVTAEMSSLSNTLTIHGKLEVMPENIISVSTPMAGFVRGIRRSSGTTVTKGEELMRLEDTGLIQLQQDYLSSASALNYARKEHIRQKELLESGAGSEKAFLQAEESMNAHLIASRSLAEKLRLLHIEPSTVTPDRIVSSVSVKAPESGTITMVYTNTGKYVQPGDELVRIIDNKGARLVLMAFEKDLPYLAKGQKIIARPMSGGSADRIGKVEQVIGDIDAEGRARIICTLDIPTREQIPGTYYVAQVEASAHKGWTVPDEALVRHEGSVFVFLATANNTYEMIKVEPGEHENGRTQIHNGDFLKDRKLAAKGAYTLLMKMKNVEE